MFFLYNPGSIILRFADGTGDHRNYRRFRAHLNVPPDGQDGDDYTVIIT